MDGSDRPATEPAADPAPAKQRRPVGAAVVIALIVAVLIGSSLWATLSGDEAGADTPDKLCTLLRGGWTADELAANDEWRDWSEHQSPASRRMDIVDAANKGDCFQLL